MYANQLNYIQACWTVGYVIGEIPSNILLTRVRPRYWIPAMEVASSLLLWFLNADAKVNSSSGPSWHFHYQDATHLLNFTFWGFSSVCSPSPTLYHASIFTQYRPRRKHLLPRHAVRHRILVPQRWTSQAILHLPHQQRYREYVLGVSHGGGVSAWWTGWVSRVAVVCIFPWFAMNVKGNVLSRQALPHRRYHLGSYSVEWLFRLTWCARDFESVLFESGGKLLMLVWRLHANTE